MGKTAIVILNYNTRDFLGRFLPGVLSTSGCGPDGAPGESGTEVSVADNGSDDGSMDLVARQFPRVGRIVLDRNYGFAEGYDRALDELKGRFEYYVLLNTDVETPEGWLEPLVAWMDSHPQCGACAPKLHSWYKSEVFEYSGAAGGLIDRFGFPFCRGRVMNMVEQDFGQYDGKAPEVFWASGACLMVRASLFHALGGLDRRFFAHMEEIDLCWRMQLEGYSTCVVPASQVLHIGGGTLPSTSPRKLLLNYRNNLLMLDNNLARTYAWEEYRKTGRAEEAAVHGLKKAARKITARMVLDGAAAAVYLVTLKFGSFMAVIKAHSGFRAMKTETDAVHLRTWLEKPGRRIDIRGRYRGCIILQAVLLKEKVFRKILES